METVEELSYSNLLMNHLNRLSMVTTSNFIDVVSKEQRAEELFDRRPSSLGETALKWGVHFLYALVPTQMIDQTMRDEYQQKTDEQMKLKKAHKLKEFPVTYQFDKIKCMINLLERKGFLMPQKSLSAFKNKKKVIEPSTDFER